MAQQADKAARLRSLKKAHLGTEAGTVQQALHNPNGNDLLALLEKRFDGAFHVDPMQHAYNAGQRSVVQWMREMCDFTMENE